MAHDQRSQQVSLGCGTLILIAFIVSFFSIVILGNLQPDQDSLKREIRGLKGEIRELKTEIGGLRKDVQAIQPAEAR
jgi:hypothetical protein